MSTSKPIPYTLKKNYVQVIVDGKPFSLQNTHPTFEKLKAAIKAKQWAKVPKLISTADAIADESMGQITVTPGKIFYKGSEIQSPLVIKIMELMKEKKPFKHMLRFMNNLYMNPSPEAINEFYEWLVDNDLPITDDGGFLAYKSVNSDFTDKHTGKISNKPGQTIMGARRTFDENYRTQCSSGFHICSKRYGLYGSRVLAVKANPKDVLSANGGKIRVTKYEVLKDLGYKTGNLFKLEGFSSLEGKVVVEIKQERKDMLKKLLATASVKSMIRKKKITKTSLLKSSYARLKSMIQRHAPETVKIGPEDANYLTSARKAAGLSIGQVSKAMKSNYKSVAQLEKEKDPLQNKVDDYLLAIAELTNVHLSRSAVTFPQPVALAG